MPSNVFKNKPFKGSKLRRENKQAFAEASVETLNNSFAPSNQWFWGWAGQSCSFAADGLLHHCSAEATLLVLTFWLSLRLKMVLQTRKGRRWTLVSLPEVPMTNCFWKSLCTRFQRKITVGRFVHCRKKGKATQLGSQIKVQFISEHFSQSEESS